MASIKNSVKNAYTKASLHSSVVNYLAEDGAICNGSTKAYNEADTYKGGVASRKSFFRYNEKIKKYHTALKVLLGERRANIYESIPVIDFNDINNTGFKYYYPLVENVASPYIKTDTIVKVPSENDKTALQLIEEEDEYTINRALNGEAVAEHFFNTTGLITNDSNLQVSPSTSEYSLYYRGIKNKNIFLLNDELSQSATETLTKNSLTTSSSYYIAASESSVVIEYNPTELLIDCTLVKNTNKKSYYYDSHNNLVLYTGGSNGTGTLPIPEYATSLTVNNKTFVTLSPSSSPITSTLYHITLEKGDIAVAIPKTSHSDGITKIIVCKKDNSVTSGNPYKVFVALAEKYTPTITLREMKALSEGEEDSKENLKDTALDNHYILSILSDYIEIEKMYTSKASGLLNGLFSEPFRRTGETGIKMGPASTVTEWRFVDDVLEAEKNHISIPVGTKYFRGHLLNRGTFLTSPLKTTEHDKLIYNGKYAQDIETGVINGKTFIIQDVLNSHKLDILSCYQVNAWNYNRTLPVVDAVITKGNYGASDLDSSSLEDLLGTGGAKVGQWQTSINAAKKFQEADGSPVTYEKVLDYIKSYNDKRISSDGKDGYYIDMTNLEECSYKCLKYTDIITTVKKNAFKDKEQTREDASTTTITMGSRDDLLNDYKKMFYIEYTSHHDSDGYIKDSRTSQAFENPQIHILTPLEAFSYYEPENRVRLRKRKKAEYKVGDTGWSNRATAAAILTGGLSAMFGYTGAKDTTAVIILDAQYRNHLNDCIVLWPEYNKYYPDNLMIISHNPIDLEPYNPEKSTNCLCTFLQDGKAVAFKCDSVTDICPSTLQWARVKLPGEIYNSSGKIEYRDEWIRLPKGLNTYEVLDSSTSNSTTIKSCKDYDCYVYLLSAVQLSFNSVELYDQNDERINITSYLGQNLILPMSSSKDYFTTVRSVDNDGALRYTLSPTGRSDLYGLNGAYIVTGLPKLSNKLPELLNKNIYYNNTTISLAPIASMLGGAKSEEPFTKVVDMLTQNCMYNLISDFNLSDGVSTSDSPATPLKLKDLPTCLNGMLELEPLVEELRKINYNLVLTDSTTITGSDFNTFYRRMHTDDEIVSGANYDVNYIDSTGSGSTFYDVIKSRLVHDKEKNTGLIINSNTSGMDVKIRPSWERLYTEIHNIFDGEYTVNECKILDKFLGNNTLPFLNLGKTLHLYDTSTEIYTSCSSDEFIEPDITYYKKKSIAAGGYEVANVKVGTSAAGYYTLENQITESNRLDSIPITPSLTQAISKSLDIVIDCIYSEAVRRSNTHKVPYNLGDSNVFIVEKYTDLPTLRNDDGNFYYVKDNNVEYQFESYTPATETEEEKTTYKMYINPGYSGHADLVTTIGAIYKGIYNKYYTEDSVNKAVNLETGDIDKTKLVVDFTKTTTTKILSNIINGVSAAEDLKVSTSEYDSWRNISSNMYSYCWKYKTSFPQRVYTTSSTYIEYPKDTVVTWTTDQLINNLALNQPTASEYYVPFNPQPQRGITLSQTLYTWYTKTSTGAYKQCKGTDVAKEGTTYYRLFNSSSVTGWSQRTSILKYLSSTLDSKATELIEEKCICYPKPNRDDIKHYFELTDPDSVSTDNCFFFWKASVNAENKTVFRLCVGIPGYQVNTAAFFPHYRGGVIEYDLTKWPSERVYMSESVFMTNTSTVDINQSTLYGLVSFIKDALVGTNGGSNSVRSYENGIEHTSDNTTDYSQTPIGNSNGLYYKRYQMLNNRMNKINGPLSKAAMLLQSNDLLNSINDYGDVYANSYKRFLTTVPIAKFNELVFMPEQDGTQGSIRLGSKFYYKDLMDELASQISNKCILTCTKCSVKDSCPFYDENELLKLYCPPAETIDLWVKDNTLDMICYERDENGNYLSPNITAYEPDPNNPNQIKVDENGNYVKKEGGSFDVSKLAEYHLPYGRIKEKSQYVGASGDDIETYNVRDIGDLIDPDKKDLSSIKEFNSLNMDMNWLYNGRYGTVEKNNIKDLVIDDEYHITDYKYLYDAVYLPDNLSYLTYYNSTNDYEVTFKKDNTIYHGTTKIKLPGTLAIFDAATAQDNENIDNDDVYLVSDDVVDDQNNEISPVIYLDTVKNVRDNLLVFGIDGNPTKSKQSETDSTIYASDIAQWAMNVYKGTCSGNPIGDIGDINNPTRDFEEDRDQIWMQTLYKKITITNANGVTQTKWIEIPGRDREEVGYQEALVSEETLNPDDVVSGKPVVANYQNFITKISLRMCKASRTIDELGRTCYAPDDIQWLIRFVKDVDSTTPQGHAMIEEKKRTLQYMKTNLRLVVVKNFE